MRHLIKYKIFEFNNNLDIIANQFISDMSKIYDLRLDKPFDKNKANCAWFTIQFFNWAKSKGIDVKIVYFDSDVEAHIAPLINGKVLDFVVKQFTKNPDDKYLILNPEDYQKWGYQSFEIYDELPQLETVFSADKLFESVNLYEESNLDWFMTHKRVGMSDEEYFKIKDYFTKLDAKHILPFNPPTKHNNDPSSFFQVTAKFNAFVKAEISKMDDDWWFVRNSNDLNGYVAYYKCDTLQGVFDLFDSFKDQSGIK